MKSKWLIYSLLFFLLLLALGILSGFFNLQFWSWAGWNAVSSIILTLTLISIAFQSIETNRLVKFTVMPTAYFSLMSYRTYFNRTTSRQDLELPSDVNINDKLSTRFIVHNNSKFPVLFYVKINFSINGKKLPSQEYYWKKPLHVYPTRGEYPEVLRLQDFMTQINEVKGKQIVAEIQYTYAPMFASGIKADKMTEIWTFDLDKYEWSTSDGVRDCLLFL
jgi:hypothetical protein